MSQDELPECLNRRYKLLGQLVGDIRTDLPLSTEDRVPEPSNMNSGKETPVSSPETPVSSPETPVSGPVTPVSCLETPVSCPVSCLETPVSCPVSCLKTPVSCPVSCLKTPDSCPVSCPETPVSNPAPLSPLNPMGSLRKTTVATTSVPQTATKNDVGVKLMCDFWKILEQDPGCDLKGEVQKRMCKDTCKGKCKKQKGRDDTPACCKQSSLCKEEDKSLQKPHGCCKHSSLSGQEEERPKPKPHSCSKPSPLYGKEEEKSLQKPHGCCKHSSLHGKEEKSMQKSPGCCKQSSSYHKGEDKSLQRCLGDVRKAASHEQRCNEKLNELQIIQKDLMNQITLLEDKASKGTGLLRQADCMWTCMETTYKNRLADSKENTEFLQTQLKEIEENMSKWKKAQKDVEAELKSVGKCCEDTNVKIIAKENDLKIIQIEIDGYNKVIKSNVKDLAAAKYSYTSKKKASEARKEKTKKEMASFQKKFSEECKKNEQKEKQSDASIKDVREDLQKLCKCLLQKKIEKEDLKAETEALVNEVELLKKACTTCKDRCARREQNIIDESKKLDREIARNHIKCTKCHKETTSADVTGFCSECPRCQLDRECRKEDDHCEMDHTQDCICTRIKQKFLDNVFDNMYTVLEKQVGSCPGKEVADCILHCLKNSRNGKLNEETRVVVQDFILSAVRQNLNLTIIGGAVKTRCEMDEDTYQQLMLCLRDVIVTQPEKHEKGTGPKKLPCTKWSHSAECHCPSGPKFCPCLKAATRKGASCGCGPSGPQPTDADEEKQDPSARFCPRPDLDGSTQGRRGGMRKSPPCTGGSCGLSANMRAAQCTLGPDALAYVRSHPSKVPALPSKAPADAFKKRDHKKSSSKEHVTISTSKLGIPTSNVGISPPAHTYPPDKHKYSGIDLTSNELTSTTSLGMSTSHIGMSTSNIGLPQSSHTYPFDKRRRSGGIYQADMSVCFAYSTNKHTYSVKKPAHSATKPAYATDKHAYTVDKAAYTVDKAAYTVDKAAYTVDKLAYTVDKPAYTIDKPAYTIDEPVYSVDEPAYSVDEPAYSAGEPAYSAGEPAYSADEPAYSADEPTYSADEPTYSADEPAYSFDEPAYSVDKPAYSIDEPAYSIDKPGYPVDKHAYTVDKPTSIVDESVHTVDKPAYSVDKPTHLADKAPYPVDKTNNQVDKPAHPVDKPACRVDKPTGLVDKVATPNYPVEESKHPVDKPTHLVDKPAFPLDKPSCAVDKTSYPVDEQTYPANETIFLDDEPVQPAFKPANLAEETPYPVEKRVYKPDGCAYPANEHVYPADDIAYPAEESAYKPDVSTQKADTQPKTLDGRTLDECVPENRECTTDEPVQNADGYNLKPDERTLDVSMPESRLYTTDDLAQKADSFPHKPDSHPQKPDGRTLDGSVPESLEYTTDDRAQIADRYSIKPDGRAYSADEPVDPAEDHPYRPEGRTQKADWRSERPDVRIFDGSARESCEFMTDERAQNTDSSPQMLDNERAQMADRYPQKVDRHGTKPNSEEIDESAHGRRAYTTSERAQKADRRMLNSSSPESRGYTTDERVQKIDWHPQKADKHPKKPDGGTLDESVLNSRVYTTDEYMPVSEKRSFMTGERALISEKRSFMTGECSPISEKRSFKTGEHAPISDRRAYTDDERGHIPERRAYTTSKRGQTTEKRAYKTGDRASNTERRVYTTGDRVLIPDKRAYKTGERAFISERRPYTTSDRVPIPDRRAYKTGERGQTTEERGYSAGRRASSPEKQACCTDNRACSTCRRQYKDSSTSADLKKAICRQDISGEELVNSCYTERKHQTRADFTDNSNKKKNCNKCRSDSFNKGRCDRFNKGRSDRINNYGRSDSFYKGRCDSFYKGRSDSFYKSKSNSFCKGRKTNFQKKLNFKAIQFNLPLLDNASTRAYLHTVSSLQKAIMCSDVEQEKIVEEIRKNILKQNESKEQFNIAFTNEKGQSSCEFTELTLTSSGKSAIKLSKQTINVLEQKSIIDPNLDTLSNKPNVILSNNYKLITSPKIPIEVISNNNESQNNKKVNKKPQNLDNFGFHININKEKRGKFICKLTSDENLLLQNIKENRITYKQELLKNKEKPLCSCDKTNERSTRNWESHIPKTLDNPNYKSEFKKIYKQCYVDVAVEIQTETGMVRKLPAVIKKTESGTIAIYTRDMLFLNEIRFNGKECPVLLSKAASRTYNVNCVDDSQSCNAILVRTLSDGMLLIPQSVRDQHPYGHNIFEVCVMRNQLLELPAVLKPTTSYNYIVVVDKEFEKCYSQTAKEYFGDQFEGSVDLQITSSGNYLLELYNKNESQLKEKKGNAWLVKTSSGNIKIIVRPEFRSIFQLELSTSSNSSAQALAQVNNELPSSSEDFLKDQPKKSKNIDNEPSIGKLKVKLQDGILKKKLSDQSAVINKDSKKSIPNSLLSDSLIYDSEKHVSIKHLDSKDIILKLNSKENEKSHYGTLKITTSGNFYVEVDDEAVKDLTESSAKSNGLDSLAGTRSKHATQLIDSVHKSVATCQSKSSTCNVSCACGCAEMMFDSRDGSIQNFCTCLRNTSVSNGNAKKVESVPIPSTSWDETVLTHIDPSYESFDSQSASHKNVFKSDEQCYCLLQKQFRNQHEIRPKETIGSVANCKQRYKVWDSLSYLPLQLPHFLRDVCCSK